MKRVAAFLRREAVFTIALAAALLSFLLTPPGVHVLRGIDTSTLLMLFSLMAVVGGLRLAGAFACLGRAVTARIHTCRALSAALVTVCFFLAMLATNDVALLTLVPFTLALMAGASARDIILTVALETIGANLGSMVTPIGNPQNLYLYASGRLTLAEFPTLTWPYALASLLLLLALTGCVSRAPLRAEAETAPAMEVRRLWLHGALGVAALLAVAKALPPWLAAALVLAGTLAFDRQALRQVDYTLLGTFLCFFVFVASVKECAPVRAWLEGLMASSPMLASLMVSQVISNVPACLLLAPFTQDTAALMLGVNLGGLGTLVASLASLISFKLYGGAEGARRGRYLAVFTLLNGVFLTLLLALNALLARG